MEIGTLVTQTGHVDSSGKPAVFRIIGYWRGYATVESLDRPGVTHKAPLSQLRGC